VKPPVSSHRRDIAPYVTKDGSEIRELMHPAAQGNSRQSLAEATLHPGQVTTLHRHHVTEELYHFTAGAGRMRLGADIFPVCAGDTVAIAPGTAHSVENTGGTVMTILCACSPAYSHEDTELLDSPET
jgi:mannose-6-phosphate isomerase-like protein (cupin superfamily)